MGSVPPQFDVVSECLYLLIDYQKYSSGTENRLGSADTRISAAAHYPP
jgi:hypothetical protein